MIKFLMNKHLILNYQFLFLLYFCTLLTYIYIYMEFEWDDDKNSNNKIKHGFDFMDAISVFNDPYRIEAEDLRKDYQERRFIMTGKVEPTKLELVVVYTLRGDKYRIISARRANHEERKLYKNHSKSI